MQRANLSMLIVVVVVAAALLAAEWYFFDYRPRLAEEGGHLGAPLPETSALSGDGSQTQESYETRSSEIIECQDSEVGKFYTDADSCEEAEPPLSAMDDSR